MRTIVVLLPLFIACCTASPPQGTAPVPASALHGSPRAIAPTAADPSLTTERSSTVRMHFLKSRGLTHTPEGCQVDHVIALHLGGRDEVENLCLVCGDKLPVKEWAERRPETLKFWLHDNKAWLKSNGCQDAWATP